jgi:cytochrome c553
MIRFHWKHIAIALAVLPVAAIFVAWIGFFNVGASSGHWKITDWFLHFAMRSAIRTYALAVDTPDELPREAIQPAAGHYARGCAICHGAPGEPRSAAALNMLPRPPDLLDVLDEWSDAELFRIVKHGVRFTGMPAWPTQERDDEVWAMVAFLRELPRLDALGYRTLAYGGDAPPLHAADFEAALAECTRCHGADGLGRSPTTPILAGQSGPYMAEALRAYAGQRRAGGVMMLAATAVDEAEWQALANHFAALPRQPGREKAADAQSAESGAAIATSGKPSAGVPACFGCHERPDRNPLYPVIAGQPRDYLETQLRLFRDGKRGGSAFSHLMTNAAKGLTDEDIEVLSIFFANRDPAPPN